MKQWKLNDKLLDDIAYHNGINLSDESKEAIMKSAWMETTTWDEGDMDNCDRPNPRQFPLFCVGLYRLAEGSARDLVKTFTKMHGDRVYVDNEYREWTLNLLDAFNDLLQPASAICEQHFAINEGVLSAPKAGALPPCQI